MDRGTTKSIVIVESGMAESMAVVGPQLPLLQISIAIGSTNPVKVNSSRDGLIDALGATNTVEVVSMKGFDVVSGVSDQPMGEAETKRGAINRAKAALDAYENEFSIAPTFAIGLEGGCALVDDTLECFAYICICCKSGKQGIAKTATFALPNEIKRLVLSGVELGTADDMVFGGVNNKQKGGTVGTLTSGVISRTEYYRQAVILAAIPLLQFSEYFC